MISNKLLFLTLLTLPRVGRKTAFNFFKTVKVNIENHNDLYSLIQEHICAGQKFPNVSKELVQDGFNKSKSLINKNIENNNVIITYGDNNYPKKIRNIEDPPLILYAKGNVHALENDNSVAVIGKRKVSKYGYNASYKVGFDLAKNNIVVVSGLALGCDTQAHKGCVDANGIGVAVLAHGLDQIHPSSNKKLVDQIVEKNGLLISEYPLGSSPSKFNYVERDRIQSGLSDAVMILETDEIGGTMKTVKFAEKQKRPLGILDYPPEAYEQGIALGNRTLIKEKRGYRFNLDENVTSFFKNITQDKASYLQGNEIKSKPIQEGFNF
ncbi:DNA-protecting protein DprA [Alphaproteobacteria bacterium]|nr:DNA-protecting protein DprA [Alphaproteobacteria bacterium]